MDKLLRRLFRRSAILVLGCAFAGSAQADWLLIQRITDANGQARSAYTWVGADRLRYDDGRMTLIANARTGELSVYDHLRRTVEQRALAKPALPTTTPFRPEKLTQFRQWPVSHYLFRKQTLHLEVATTEQVPPDLETQYKRLMNAIAAGSDARAYALPGIPVIITVTEVSTGALLSRRETLSMVQRNPHPATYRMPSGYRSMNAE